jgi:CelD/BcsL family acetyltransferase involved in cellulose biosynthesis
MTGSPPSMTSELITDLAGIDEIEDEWRALAELRGNAFVTPEWFRSWEGERPDSTPLVAAARREDGSLAGVMPLVLDATKRPRAIRFGGANFGDRFVPAAREADEEAVVAAAMTALQEEGMDRYMLLLDHVDQERPWWQQMQRASRVQRAEIEQQQWDVAYIDFDGLDGWEGYLASRSRNFRSQIRRRERALRNDHQVEVRSATEATLRDDLAQLFDLHDRRWQGRDQSSSLQTSGAKPALSRFAELALGQGWLRLRLLQVDGEPVAGFLGWRLGETYSFYQSGFDPDWAEKSVGVVMMATTVRSALEEGAGEFDMLLGDEPYKQRFTNASRPVHTVILPKSISPTRLLVAGEARARRVGRRLAERPALGKALRSMTRLLPTARRN